MSIAAGADIEVTWRPGATFAGFRLVTRIARGTTTEVWLAKIMGAEGFEKVIALKTLRAGSAPAAEATRMFTGEWSITARLYHPNIVQLVDCGHVDDHYYMAMEFVDGMTLRQLGSRLKELGRPVPLRLLVRIGIEICAALHYAHELTDADGAPGFLHRDLEPENVMITRAGAVKVIDFGAARRAMVGAALRPFAGKLRYAAPEVVQGMPEDRRCDIYSLGTILYELITGVPAYDGDSLRVVSRIIEGKPRPPVALVPELPEALSAIVLRAMAARSEDRYPTAEHMAAALQAFLDQVPLPPDRSQSMDVVLRTVFQGMAGSFWREVLSPTARPMRSTATKSNPMERFAPDALDGNDEVTCPSVVASYPGDGSLRDPPSTHAPPNGEGDQLRLRVAVLAAVPMPRTDEAAVAIPALPEDLEQPTKPPVWLFERRSAAPLAAPEIFSSGSRAGVPAPRPPEVSGSPFATTVPNRTLHAGPDAFAIRRGGAPDPVAAWIRNESRVPHRTEAPPPARPPTDLRATAARAAAASNEAARCFDRGLAHVSERRYVEALAEWQRADTLDPGNRLYETNLKRLRAHCDRHSPDESTEVR